MPNLPTPRVAFAALVALVAANAVGCADLQRPAAPPPTAPSHRLTSKVAYFVPATASDAATDVERVLREVIIPVAVARDAELSVYRLNDNTYATSVPIASALFDGLSDNPDLRAKQVASQGDMLLAAVRIAPTQPPSPTSDVVGVFRVAAELRRSITEDGRLLVVVGGDAVPTTTTCAAPWAGTDDASASRLADSCMGGVEVRTPKTDYWFPTAGLGPLGRFTEDDTIATRKLLAALVARAGGRLCPFEPRPLADDACNG